MEESLFRLLGMFNDLPSRAEQSDEPFRSFPTDTTFQDMAPAPCLVDAVQGILHDSIAALPHQPAFSFPVLSTSFILSL